MGEAKKIKERKKRRGCLWGDGRIKREKTKLERMRIKGMKVQRQEV